jgi:hypothetical protein
MDDRIDSLRKSLTGAGEHLAEVLDRTSTQLETISRQQALQPPEQKVYVQHTVPRVMLDLVKGQFHLMQEWMRPLLNEAARNGRDLETLRSEIQGTLAAYHALQQELEEADEEPPNP